MHAKILLRLSLHYPTIRTPSARRHDHNHKADLPFPTPPLQPLLREPSNIHRTFHLTLHPNQSPSINRRLPSRPHSNHPDLRSSLPPSLDRQLGQESDNNPQNS